jgi:NAD(P)H dehydrogenase (quinone)
MKKVLIINGHPDPDSYCYALANAYKMGALNAGASVETIHIGTLNFNPNLAFGYSKRTELEPDLLKAIDQIKDADHLVFIHPVWWGSYPAIMKGFIDRVFLPEIVFRKKENSLWWEKFLKGKSARIIATMDQPPFYYWLINGAPSHRSLKQQTLKFCGISPVRTTSIGPIRLSTEKFRKAKLEKVKTLGLKLI